MFGRNVQNDIKRVFSNTFFLSVLQLLNYAAPLMLLPFLTRVLSLEEFGVVMVTLATIQFACIVSDYGFSLSATYKISINREDPDFVNEIISRIFSAKLILLVFALLITFSISFFPAYEEHRNLFIVALGAVIAQTFQPIWLFQGLERMKGFVVYMSISKVFYVLLALMLVSNNGDGVFVILSWMIANIAGLIAAFFCVRRLGYRLGLSSFSDAKSELIESAQYFWSRLAVATYTSASSIIVGTTELTQAALYSAAEQAYKGGQSFTRPVTQATYPYMAKNKNWLFFYKMTFILFVILSVGCFIVWSYGGLIITIIFGDAYSDAVPILNVFLLILLVNYLGVSFGYPACAAIGRPDIANKSVIYGSLIYFILVALLYFFNEIKALNIALLVLLVEMLVMGVRVIWVCKVKGAQVENQ